MKNQVKYQHPDITDEMWRKMDAILASYTNKKGALIAALRECQSVVGYLPPVLFDYVSEGMNIARSEVFGVATFYSLFSRTPKGRHNIRVCMGTACYVKGIKETIERISKEYNLGIGETTQDRRFSLESVRCLGACGLAPVVVINQDTHGSATPDGMISILKRYQ